MRLNASRCIFHLKNKPTTWITVIRDGWVAIMICKSTIQIAYIYTIITLLYCERIYNFVTDPCLTFIMMTIIYHTRSIMSNCCFARLHFCLPIAAKRLPKVFFVLSWNSIDWYFVQIIIVNFPCVQNARLQENLSAENCATKMDNDRTPWIFLSSHFSLENVKA